MDSDCHTMSNAVTQYDSKSSNYTVLKTLHCPKAKLKLKYIIVKLILVLLLLLLPVLLRIIIITITIIVIIICITDWLIDWLILLLMCLTIFSQICQQWQTCVSLFCLFDCVYEWLPKWLLWLAVWLHVKWKWFFIDVPVISFFSFLPNQKHDCAIRNLLTNIVLIRTTADQLVTVGSEQHYWQPINVTASTFKISLVCAQPGCASSLRPWTIDGLLIIL